MLLRPPSYASEFGSFFWIAMFVRCTSWLIASIENLPCHDGRIVPSGKAVSVQSHRCAENLAKPAR